MEGSRQVPRDDLDIDRPDRGNRRGNLILLAVFLLICSLLFIPALKIVLEDPSKRPLALVAVLAILALLTVLFTLPKRRWEDHHADLGQIEDRHEPPEEAEQGINEVAALTELRALALRRVQLRQRKDDREMKSAMRSPEVLMALVGDDLIEELILEDPRYLAWKMGQGEFMDAYERLLARVEAWK
jgi:hypothetical protein